MWCRSDIPKQVHLFPKHLQPATRSALFFIPRSKSTVWHLRTLACAIMSNTEESYTSAGLVYVLVVLLAVCLILHNLR